MSPFYSAIGSFTKIGGTITGTNEALGKVIFSSAAVTTSLLPNTGVGEIISVKGYSPFTRYFNYTNDDKLIYEIPSDLTDLSNSLYNSYFNKTS